MKDALPRGDYYSRQIFAAFPKEHSLKNVFKGLQLKKKFSIIAKCVLITIEALCLHNFFLLILKKFWVIIFMLTYSKMYIYSSKISSTSYGENLQ